MIVGNEMSSNTALILIDVINDFEFEESSRLLRFAIPAAAKISRLRKRLKRRGIPVIYVNDNFGRWQSDFKEQIERCVGPEAKGREVSGQLVPEPDDYFVLKPKHSGFFSTSLDVLLGVLGVDTLVLAGFAGDICVLYTANDAYMRDYNLIIPSDCIASERKPSNDAALVHMKTRLRARVCQSKAI